VHLTDEGILLAKQVSSLRASMDLEVASWINAPSSGITADNIYALTNVLKTRLKMARQ
jgi:hypothetical protein